jgi:hypothetical protein
MAGLLTSGHMPRATPARFWWRRWAEEMLMLSRLNEAKPPEWAAFSLEFPGSCGSRSEVEIRRSANRTVYLVPGGRGLLTGLFTLFGFLGSFGLEGLYGCPVAGSTALFSMPVVLLPVEAPPAVPVLPPVVEPAVPAPVPPAPAEPAPAPPAPPAPPPPAPPPPPPPWAKAAVLKSSAQIRGTSFLYILISSICCCSSRFTTAFEATWFLRYPDFWSVAKRCC